MRVLIACEHSGVVRDEFIHLGCDAVSCDILPTEKPGPHIQDDVLNVLYDPWDLMIAFPPCTHLASSGARWFAEKQVEQAQALDFVRALWYAPIPRICIENPIGILSSALRKPDQIIQPWMFGADEVKSTCLWLKNLPPLQPTQIAHHRFARVHGEPPSPDRWKRRSKTYTGVAIAMAQQWGEL